MRKSLLLTLAIALVAAAPGAAQMEMEIAEPFKVGTFEIDGAATVGLVLRDQLIVELNAANRALELNPRYPALPMPADMLELISRYEYGMKARLYEVVNHLAAHNMIRPGGAPYIHDVEDVHILPPIMYPGKVLNAAVNFYSHVNESGTDEERAEARRQRRVNRGVPYLFLKPTRGAIIGTGDPIIIPYGRDRTDWEVELGAVIGRPAKYVSANHAENFIFGYMVSIDVSDRGGRPPGGFGQGSDWFVGKGHDTFAPQGPWIVPKEFYGNPMEILRQTLAIEGDVLQEAHGGDMIHTLWELIEYGSSIVTLFPGDVINNGTSGGTAAGVAQQRNQEVRYMQPGQTVEASIDGIGTLVHPVLSEPMPQGLTGAQLPPVNSYRRR